MKRIFIVFCMLTLAVLATSCYTNKPCPAYGHYSELRYEK